MLKYYAADKLEFCNVPKWINKCSSMINAILSNNILCKIKYTNLKRKYGWTLWYDIFFTCTSELSFLFYTEECNKQMILTCDAISRDWHKGGKKKHTKCSLDND